MTPLPCFPMLQLALLRKGVYLGGETGERLQRGEAHQAKWFFLRLAALGDRLGPDPAPSLYLTEAQLYAQFTADGDWLEAQLRGASGSGVSDDEPAPRGVGDD